ncbi:MAG: ribosome assembly factor SBDS [Candidatus Diapherotrites archaeon]|nr:ribosome assembly factor SBDS [Candidatus Diapherotrites archaeon]
MVKINEAVIARLEKAGHKFEALVDPNLALALKSGQPVKFDDLIAIDKVFKDAHKGEEQSPETIQKAFQTADLKEVVRQIILKGEVQLTTEQRKELKEKKRKEIIQVIMRNAIDPQTKNPHPLQRIELAMEEAKVSIDPLKPTAEQVQLVLKEIKKIIPIAFEKLDIAVRIPAEFAPKAPNALRDFETSKQEWQRDGSLILVVSIPAGLKNELFNIVNKLSQGRAETRILDQKQV